MTHFYLTFPRSVISALAISILLPLCMALVAAGCADGHPAVSTKVDKPAPTRIAEVKEASGVAIDLTEADDGWKIVEHTSKVFKASAVIDQTNAHTQAIMVGRVYPPKTHFKNVREFSGYIRDDLQEHDGLGGEQVGGILVLDATPNEVKAPFCVSYHRKVNTVEQKKNPGVTFVLDEFGYLCRHPANPTIFVRMSYSERYPVGKLVVDVELRAQAMFENLKFLK